MCKCTLHTITRIHWYNMDTSIPRKFYTDSVFTTDNLYVDIVEAIVSISESGQEVTVSKYRKSINLNETVYTYWERIFKYKLSRRLLKSDDLLIELLINDLKMYSELKKQCF